MARPSLRFWLMFKIAARSFGRAGAALNYHTMQTWILNKVIKATIIYLVAVIIMLIVCLSCGTSKHYPNDVKKTVWHENN